jgi:hypothetical protein
MAAGNGPDRIFGGYQGLDWLPGQIRSAFWLASVARILYPVCASHATGPGGEANVKSATLAPVFSNRSRLNIRELQRE